MRGAVCRMVLAVASIAGWSVAGCKFPVPEDVPDDGGTDDGPVVCTQDGPDPACPPEEPICTAGTCGGACTTDQQCELRTDGRGVCLSSTGDCVTCDESDVQAPPGSAEDECPTPSMAVCDAESRACRACEAHTECASGVCDAGTCVAVENVVYLSEGGRDAGDCLSPETGCITLQYAIDKLTNSRKYILLLPTPIAYRANVDDNAATFRNRNAYIVGYGAVLRPKPNVDAPVIRLESGALVVEGLTIERAEYGSGSGIDSYAPLDLRSVTLRDNSRFGVSSAASLRITRSIVAGNRQGGIWVSSGTYQITNNMITTNGGLEAVFGGVNITTALGAGNRLDFNTIAFNSAHMSFPDGVSCVSAGLVARNNIIFGNVGRPRVNLADTNCVFTHTLYGPDGTVPGGDNLIVTDVLAFMFNSVTDLHILPNSVAAGKAESMNLTTDTMVDFDGDRRDPGSASLDVGADEIP